MAKKIETTTTQHKREEMTAMRALWQKHHRFVAVMGCVVAMATSIALVVPVMSFTEDAADEVGIVLEKHVDETAASDEIATGYEATETAAEEEASEEAVENAHVEADNEAEAQVVADEEIAADQIANDEKENVVEQYEVAS